MNEQQTRAQQLTIERYQEGFNCAESVLRAFRDDLGLDLSDEALKIASGFGGGGGQAGCMCGALAASIMVISLLQGRTSPDQSRKPLYENTRAFHGIFTRYFGAACCRVLNPHSGTAESKHTCYRITGETARLLAQFLAAQGLTPVGEQPAQ